ncbi:Hypothetical predicted protein, partial [Pelobates cultripes]
ARPVTPPQTGKGDPSPPFGGFPNAGTGDEINRTEEASGFSPKMAETACIDAPTNATLNIL